MREASEVAAPAAGGSARRGRQRFAPPREARAALVGPGAAFVGNPVPVSAGPATLAPVATGDPGDARNTGHTENAMTPDPNATPLAPPSPPERWDRAHRRHHYRHHRRFHGLFPGLVLVAWGGLLLLREMGYLSAELHPFDFWPLILIGAGISMVLNRFRFGSMLVGLAIAALGAGLLAQKLGYVAGIAHLWPLLLIAAGLGVIVNGFGRRHHHLSRLPDEKVSADELRRSVSMGGLAVTIDSQQFKGGALGVTMGEIKADLRRAAIAGEEATLEVSVTMGGIELYVPTNWQVVSDVSPFMGSVEDKTDPRPDGAGVQRRLVLRGAITMGAVTVRN